MLSPDGCRDELQEGGEVWLGGRSPVNPQLCFCHLASLPKLFFKLPLCYNKVLGHPTDKATLIQITIHI